MEGGGSASEVCSSERFEIVGIAGAGLSTTFVGATLYKATIKRDDGTFVEIFYMQREACLWRGRTEPDANGNVAVPDGPGLGYEPDRDVMERYRAA